MRNSGCPRLKLTSRCRRRRQHLCYHSDRHELNDHGNPRGHHVRSDHRVPVAGLVADCGVGAGRRVRVGAVAGRGEAEFRSRPGSCVRWGRPACALRLQYGSLSLMLSTCPPTLAKTQFAPGPVPSIAMYTPNSRITVARLSMRPSTANLAALYASLNGRATTPFTLVRVITRPARAAGAVIFDHPQNGRASAYRSVTCRAVGRRSSSIRG
jgi:hypothetical protein